MQIDFKGKEKLLKRYSKLLLDKGKQYYGKVNLLTGQVIKDAIKAGVMHDINEYSECTMKEFEDFDEKKKRYPVFG